MMSKMPMPSKPEMEPMMEESMEEGMEAEEAKVDLTIVSDDDLLAECRVRKLI